MKISMKLMLAGFVVSFVSLQAVVDTQDTRGLFSFLSGDKKEAAKVEKITQAQKEDVAAIIENLDNASPDALRCGNCHPPKKLHVCELCAKRIYTMCLFAEVAKIKDLFIKHEKVEKIWAYAVHTCKLCAHDAKIEHLWNEKAHIECAKIEKLCAEHGDIDKLKTDHLWTNKLLANCAMIDHLYTPHYCSKYKATAILSQPLIGFQLNNRVKFDAIIDDPNGNIDNSGDKTQYIAPISGYYIATLDLDVSNLNGSKVITGTPTTHLTIVKNGHAQAHCDYPVLTFNTSQNSVLTALMHLNAGDVIDCHLQVFVIDPTTGFTSYQGTVDLANPTSPIHPDAVSYFMIHNLSADCDYGCHCPPPPCGPCHCDMPPCDFGHEDCHMECPDTHSGCHDDCDNDHHECCPNDHHEDCDDHHHGHGTAPTIVINYDNDHHGHDGWRDASTLKPVPAPTVAAQPKEEEMVSMDEFNWAFEAEVENAVNA